MLHNGENHIPHDGTGLLADDLPDHRRLGFLHRVAVGIHHLTDDVRLHQVAAVDHGGDGAHQLNGGNIEGLAEGAGNQRGGGAVGIGVREHILREEVALGFAGQSHTGGLHQAEICEILIKFLIAQPQANVGKGQVAGVLQGIEGGLRAMATVPPAVQRV